MNYSFTRYISLFFCFCIALIIATSAYAQSIIYVNHAATGANDGNSWNDAYTSLQDALQAAQSGDEVWVAQGVYRPDQGAGIVPGDREASFVISSGVSRYGGFSGVELSRDQRDWGAFETVLTGDLQQDDDDLLTLDNPTRLDNSHHVVRIHELVNDSTVDGFTISGGQAERPLFDEGSGIRIRSHLPGQTARAYISNCLFTKNVSIVGTIYISAVSNGTDPVVVISDSELRHNKIIGIFVEGGTTLIRNVVIADNEAPGATTAIWIINETVYLVDSTISNNFSSNTIFLGGSGSGKLYMWNNKIIGNYGGGTHVEIFEAEFVSINNVFSGNTSPSVDFAGGAMYLNGAKARIINNVFAFNSIGGTGGAIHNLVSDVSISNPIFYQNNSPNEPDLGNAYPDFGSTRISHSLLQNPIPSYVTDRGGLLFGGSFFVDADGADDIPGTLDDDFRLTNFSSAIDAGINDSLFVDFWDLDNDGDFDEFWPTDFYGDPRIIGIRPSSFPVVDLGPFEFNGPPPTAIEEDESPGVNGPPIIGVYPNPFASNTSIIFTLDQPSEIRIEVYNILGKRVRVLEHGFRAAGEHSVQLVADELSTGVYFVRLSAGSNSQTRKMVVVQ